MSSLYREKMLRTVLPPLPYMNYCTCSFDYWKKNFERQLDKDKLWDLSEVLNVLIMEQQPFLEFAGQGAMPYPAHKELYAKLKVIYEKRKSIHDFIARALTIL